jgi:similar to stage IV sporulation protein
MVWDVRVVGNENVSDYRLIDALSASGFGVGDRWNRIDKNKVEVSLLSEFEEISWISINRRGTVAYVEVIESKKPKQQAKWDDGYCNIVADGDGVIEEIVVEQGMAVVSVGDVVRKGDVLISGVIENDSGVYFCAAKGSVKAQLGTTISAYVPRSEVKKRYKRTIISEIDLNIFKNTINIFKNYGNPKGEYDIIYDVREYALFGKYRLPVSCMYTCFVEYTEEEVVYTETQMAELAGRILSGKLRSSFANCDVVKIKTTGKFENDGYVITSYVIYSAEIGTRSVIGNN